jgi:MFS family permease
VELDLVLNWINRDGKLLLASKIIRAVGYGFLSIILTVYLKLLGYNEVLIGLALTVTLINSAVFTILASFAVRRFGRKKTMLFFAALMSISGAIFVISTNYVGLLFAAFIGTINVTGNDVGPFQSLEQSIIPQTCLPNKRTLAFAAYSTGAALAMSGGSLLANVPSVLQGFGFTVLDSFRVLFSSYVFIGVATIILYMGLSKGVEPPRETSATGKHQILSGPSKRIVAKLSLLGGLDSMGTGFVLQSIVSYWFFTRFGASLEQLSLVFFGAGLLTAVSFVVSARLADRHGLVNTMVFTHLASNILTILVPFAPTLFLAMAAWIVRGFLNPMDSSPRQSYLAAVVTPNERVAAVAYTNVTRNSTQAISPLIAGYALQFLSLSSPFIIGGGLKALYDIMLYFSFKALKPPEELEGRFKASIESGKT